MSLSTLTVHTAFAPGVSPRLFWFALLRLSCPVSFIRLDSSSEPYLSFSHLSVCSNNGDHQLHRRVCAKVVAFDPRNNPGGQLPRVKGGTGLRPGRLARPPQRGSPFSRPGSFRKPLDGPWEATLPLRPGWCSQTQSACRPGLTLWREVKTQHKWARTPGHRACGWRCGHCSGRGGGRPQEDDQSDLVTPRVWGGKEEGTPAQAWKPTVSREKGQNS